MKTHTTSEPTSPFSWNPALDLGDLRRRADAVLDHALGLDREERRAYIVRATMGEPSLRSLVLSLFSSMEEDDEEIEGATALAAWRRKLARPTPFDEEVGPYRLVREIGSGGMGVVYLAERADGVLEQEVAVKVLPMTRVRSLGERFSQERQILAHLDHPGIARLLDAGTTQRGLPYLVMEHVDGEAIDRYCETRWLSLEARLRLFIEVCEAVEAAHRSLVVHRDIKPSNILVNAAGRPKLLDFGIAKLIAEESSSAQPTTSGMLTLEWASPEQIQGDPTTVQSDVYQLGLLLHVLLTGQLPFILEGLSPVQQVAAICDREALPPSVTVRGLPEDLREERAERLKVSSLEKRLKGDLDAIVLEALRKEPSHRYESVSSMRRDIEKHLSQLPITARLPTLRYRTGRFLARRRFAVASAAVALVAFLSLGVYSFERITTERNLARAEAARAEERVKESRAVSEFLAGLLERSNPHDPESRRGELTVREALELGVEQLETDLHDAPLVRARVLAQMGNIFNILGDAQRSFEMNREAAALFAGFGGSGSREHIQALVNLGGAHRAMAELHPAHARFNQALLYAYPQKDSLLVSQILSELAITADMSGSMDDAERYFGAALEASADLEDEHGRIHRTLLLSNLGILNKNLGIERSDPAAFVKAERFMKQALGEIEVQPELASRLPMVRMNLGNVYYRMGRFEESEATLRRALAGLRKVFGPASPQVAMGRNNLGRPLIALGRFDEAQFELQQALRLREQILGESHPKVASVLRRLGSLRLAEQRPALALPLLERALEIQTAAYSKKHPQLAETHLELARCRRELDQEDGAARHFDKAVALFEAVGSPERAEAARRELKTLASFSAHFPQPETSSGPFEKLSKA